MPYLGPPLFASWAATELLSYHMPASSASSQQMKICRIKQVKPHWCHQGCFHTFQCQRVSTALNHSIIGGRPSRCAQRSSLQSTGHSRRRVCTGQGKRRVSLDKRCHRSAQVGHICLPTIHKVMTQTRLLHILANRQLHLVSPFA